MLVNPTNSLLAQYVGWDMVVENGTRNYVFRGPIKKAFIDGVNIRVDFEWLAKGVGFPPRRWVDDKNICFAVSRLIAEATMDSLSKMLIIVDRGVGDTAFFHPPGSRRLSRGQVF